MRYLLILLLTGCSSIPYAKIGAGYKMHEPDILWVNEDTGRENRKKDPFSARIEVGLKNDSWTYGVSHHSQWFSGKPFNKDLEYYKTELFIDYTFEFK